MARQTYSNLISILKTKIQGIKDDNSVVIFDEVFDYGESNFSKYPAAVIIERAGTGDTIDTHRNERTFQFSIFLYQEMSNAGKSKSEAAGVMRRAVDKVMEAFDIDPTLSSEVVKVEVVPVSIDFSVRQGVFIFAEFDIKIVALVNNYNV